MIAVNIAASSANEDEENVITIADEKKAIGVPRLERELSV
ncbi:10642_t:CDS:2 [Funneliformis caledonium]|uniref:10642_t:CDS:1 n=1 Tax=Funneliformis caledonium TaxID=1117310 RepID=A0A9N9DNC6_9GLOM|nr:10642_t:CDS:2 [Funneliformis caledonium]